VATRYQDIEKQIVTLENKLEGLNNLTNKNHSNVKLALDDMQHDLNYSKVEAFNKKTYDQLQVTLNNEFEEVSKKIATLIGSHGKHKENLEVNENKLERMMRDVVEINENGKKNYKELSK